MFLALLAIKLLYLVSSYSIIPQHIVMSSIAILASFRPCPKQFYCFFGKSIFFILKGLWISNQIVDNYFININSITNFLKKQKVHNQKPKKRSKPQKFSRFAQNTIPITRQKTGEGLITKVSAMLLERERSSANIFFPRNISAE